VGGDSDLADERFDVPIIKTETLFDGSVWSVQRHEFRYRREILAREFVDHTGAVAVLALDKQERIVLIRQYRHPIGMRNWEIPAGLLDVADESPLDAAKRELAEEADLEARDWAVLSEFVTSPGGSNEAIRIYLARDVNPSEIPFERGAEEADIEVRWVDLDEAVDAVLDRRLQNPSLVVAVLTASVERSRNWQGLASVAEPWNRRPANGPRGHGTG
jgi:8-oxo-dGTP pyrophosphatase MutT (NUDIX family)